LGSTPAHGAYYYPPTWEGLLRCYEMALPFFRNQLLGDGLFSVAFFGIYAAVQQKWAWRVAGRVPSSQKTMAG
ncbi:MAG TPA: hypothetical protein PKD72_06180, partial [Gemmatales bacterium]|nr:hypothetical protein [Gemmatales bacterium]